MNTLPDPDTTGSAEYRAMHELLANAEDTEHALAILETFRDHAIYLIQLLQNAPKKVFTVNPQIGKAKHSISFHDGKKTHPDGSPFHDLHIAKSKTSLAAFASALKSEGYSETP